MIGERVIRIGWAAAGLLMLAARERLSGVPASDSALPQRLRASLDRLGPTFIKLGQALSLRRDLLPDAYLAALHTLQAQASPFPPDQARVEIERELGRNIDAVFSEFEPQPMAAASIAQVHRARLHDGTVVIVKVRRPAIRARIDRDMRLLIHVLKAAVVLQPGLARYQPVRLVEEIWANLERETDLRQEARNVRRFAEAFKDRTDVYIPPVVEDLCREGVMVQAMSHGRSIDDPAVAADGPRLGGVLVDFYLQQFFVIGLFHGDPHPGNLFVMEDGRICFHDFGLVGSLDRSTRRNLAIFLLAFIHQDADWMVDSAVDLGLLGGVLDRTEIARGMEEVLADYVSLPLKDCSIADVFLRVTRLGSGGNVLLPYRLVVLMRTLFLIEGALRTLDPEFNVLDTLVARGEAVLLSLVQPSHQSAALARLQTAAAVTAQDIPALVGAWLHRTQRADGAPTIGLDVPRLRSLEEHLDRASNRLALALVTLGLFIAASLLMQHSIGPRVLGNIPLLGLLGYGLALWLSIRLVRAAGRSGRL